MKSQTIQHVPDTEIRAATKALVKRLGNLSKVSAETGEPRPMLSDFMNGVKNPGRKLLDYFGLEKKVVYASKTKESQ